VRFNPSRLVIARKRRGFSRVALARESGLGVRSIVYYESGEVVPSDEAVSSLVGTLRFPQTFFFGPDMAELNPHGVSFRSLSSMTAAQRDSALAAGAVALEFSKFIEARFELPRPTLPDLREFEPETAAQVLRTEWKIGERPIKNVVHLLEAHGARVFSLPVDSASVDAFSAWHDGLPLVLLNTMKSAERGRMDAAHELAHLTLHTHGGPRSRQAEVEADRFASAFLMPAGDILAHSSRNISPTAILRMKGRWGVSAMALVRRLMTLQVLTEWKYRTLCVEFSKRGYRRSEPNGIARDNSQVITKVLRMLREEGVQRSMIAKDLRIDRTELEAFLTGLVIAPVPSSQDGGQTLRQSQAKTQPPKLRVVQGKRKRDTTP